MTGPEWMDRALCAQVDPALFFPGKKGDGSNTTAQAKKVCKSCDVQPECLESTLDYEAAVTNGGHSSGAFIGVYGGLSPVERRKIVRARQREAS